MKTSSKSRLFRDGHRIDAPWFGLSEKDILTIERLELEPEGLLGRTSIADQFDPTFFKTDFWFHQTLPRGYRKAPESRG